MTTANELNTQELWGFQAPTIPTLDPAVRANFFQNAPEGTVVEFQDELYMRAPSGNWLHLEELVSAGGSYSDYQEHDSSTPEYLANSLTGDHTLIRVLRVGEALRTY